MDTKKYLKQYVALEEAAKAEIIQLLSNNPAGHYIYFNCNIDEENEAYCESVFPIMDGDEHVLHVCGVGLNDDNHIVIITEYDEKNWFEPDEWTHAYLELYEFVVNNLDYAKREIVSDVTDAGKSNENTRKSDDKELSNEDFLGIIADQYTNNGLSKDELIKAGGKGLVVAREKYDEEKGFSFHDFAEWFVRQAIIDAIAEKKKML